jgi:RNA polymerase sigma-70 factor (ECF subfamily)
LDDQNVTTLSDTLLLERVAHGDVASFEALFYRHYDRVYGLLFRLVGNRAEAEDLTQEVFLKLYNHAFGKRLFRRRPQPGQEHSLTAWLYRVATNSGYNAIRGRRRRQSRDTALLPESESTPTTEQEVERRQQAALVRATLARLPERQVQLLLLRQMDFSYAECAAVCAVAPGSVGTLLARAAEAFRKTYEIVASDE